ncbi:hypothetical protein HY478_02370 [Candidatus Uhrbacteria bacterium]|nr:hypothetical protein [Candidatus Uhrbacteria bacterium]
MKWKLAPKKSERLNSTKVFIAARHGQHDREHRLTACGAAQMRKLAAAIRKVATKRNLRIEILSSAEPCALRGARIVAEELGMYDTQVISHECFWADGSHVGDFAVAQKMIEALFRDGTLLLLVSNVLMSHRLARYIAAKENFDAKRAEIVHGQGLMVAHKGVSIIPRPQ